MVRELIHSNNIGEALRKLRDEVKAFPGEGFSDRVEKCHTEFHYMCDFMMQGYQDPSRSRLYSDLQQRLLDLWYDICVRKDIIESAYIKGLRKTIFSQDTSMESLQSRLVMSTDPKEHYDALNVAFIALYASYHWKPQQLEEWTAFLSSPKTDAMDACCLLGAIMLSCLQHYSHHKAMCLAQTYLNATNEDVRQRAFVGAMLAMSYADDSVSVSEIISLILSQEQSRKSLLEMQMQMISCANADKDGTEIKKNLMPNIMRNQPFHITEHGIEERDDDDDCIDTGASERRMQDMEKSISQMLKMQKAGADIFFEGFSQMKRYPFFYKMSNWFMPFDLKHPDIATYISQLQNTTFVEKITTLGPFCSSDKYSFAIAFSGVMNQMPNKIREMMNSGELGPIGMHKEGDDFRTPSLLRLQYLQDLFRFFRLNPIATNIHNPYLDTSLCKAWTIAAAHLSDKDLYDMCVYLLKQHDESALSQTLPLLLEAFKEKNGMSCLLCQAEYDMQTKSYISAIENYNKCLAIQPNHKGCMRGIAKAYYANGDYARAAYYFDALHTLVPERLSYALNYAMSMVKEGMSSDVINELYRLEYEHPDDMTIRNTLGWALLYAGKAEQALTLYNKGIIADDDSMTLNHAYSMLFTGNVSGAMELLSHSFTAEKLLENMQEERDLLRIYNYGDAEIAVLADNLRR